MFKLIDDTNTNNLKLVPRSGARRFHPSVIEITTSRLRILRSGLQKSVEVFSATLSDPSIKAMVELTAQVAIDENLKADESIQAEHQRIVHHFAALEENTSPITAQLEQLQTALDEMPNKLNTTEIVEQSAREAICEPELKAAEEQNKTITTQKTALLELEYEKLTELDIHRCELESDELAKRGAVNCPIEIGASITPTLSSPEIIYAGIAGRIGLVIDPSASRFIKTLKEGFVTTGMGLAFAMNLAALWFGLKFSTLGKNNNWHYAELIPVMIVGFVLALIFGEPVKQLALKSARNKQLAFGMKTLDARAQELGQTSTWLLISNLFLMLITVILEGLMNFGGLAGDKLMMLASNTGTLIDQSVISGLTLSLKALCIFQGFAFIAYKATLGATEGEQQANKVIIDAQEAILAQEKIQRAEEAGVGQATGKTQAFLAQIARVQNRFAELQQQLQTQIIDLDNLKAKQAQQLTERITTIRERFGLEQQHLEQRKTECLNALQQLALDFNSFFDAASQRIEDTFSKAEDANTRFERVLATTFAECDKPRIAAEISDFNNRKITIPTSEVSEVKTASIWKKLQTNLRRLLAQQARKPKNLKRDQP